MERTAELEDLLEKLQDEEHQAEARGEARAFLARHGTERFLELEEELRRRGVSEEHLKLLCPSHCAAVGDDGGAFRASLPEGHVIATLMDEHRRMLALLDRLEALAHGELREQVDLESVRSIGAHLVGAEPHHQREERALFPRLRERGISGPPDVMESEHVLLREHKHAVLDLALRLLSGDATCRSELRAVAHALVAELRSHIEKEDKILYPLAVRTLTDAGEWQAMKRECDAIGYCCSHDSHQRSSA
jgi:hypothetical protein